MPNTTLSVGLRLFLRDSSTTFDLVNSKLQHLIRWALFALACCVLYYELVFAPKGTEHLPRFLWAELTGPAGLTLLLVLAMVPLNWGLETVKWQFLVRRIHRVPFLRAFAAVLVGTAMGLFTPNRTGEFLGRVLFIDPEKRIKAVFATALGSLAQFVITLIVGTVALGFYLMLGLPSALSGQFVNQLVMVLAFSSGMVALVVYLFPGILKRTVDLIPFLNKWKKHAEILTAYPRKELLRVLGLSFARYVVFAGQFMLALIAFDVSVGIGEIALTIPIIYLVTTIVPTVFLTEMAVRGAIAVSIFEEMGANTTAVVLATFTIWTFNLVLPSIFGAVLFLFAKIKWKRAEA